MSKNNGSATIREVYNIVERVEMKLDKISDRVSVLEVWRATVIAKATMFIAFVNIAVFFAADWVKSKFK